MQINKVVCIYHNDLVYFISAVYNPILDNVKMMSHEGFEPSTL